MARDVSTLNTPPSRAGARAQQTTGQQDPWLNQRQYQGSVLTEPNSAGRCRVSIGGESKVAYLSPTAKAVGVGDTVNVTKGHGRWVITENLTWHQPPPAGPAPSTSTPGSAQKPSTYTLRTVDDDLRGATSTSTSALQAWTYTCASDVRAHGDAINRLNSQMAAIRSAVTNNATRQNQVRDVATSTRDSMSGIRQGALQDRIVR